LKAFNKFENISEALSSSTLLIDSKPSKDLRKFLRTHCEGESLAVADSKLGNAIKEKLVCLLIRFRCVVFTKLVHYVCYEFWPTNFIGECVQKIDCVHNNAVMELMRGVRSQLTELISGLGVQDLAPMSLGLSHSLSRFKLKFSPDKVILHPYMCFQYYLTC